MIWAALLAVALAGEPPPPCRHYEIVWAAPNCLRADTVDEHYRRVVVLDDSGRIVLIVNEYTGISPEVYRLTHRLEETNKSIERLDSLLKEVQKK